MVKPLSLLVGGSLAAFGLAYVLRPASLSPAALGLAITLPPAVWSLLAVGWVCRRWPEAGPTVIMAGAGLRMGWAVVGVSVLGRAVEKVGIPRASLAEWTCGFYLVTLALETAGLWGRLARNGRPVAGSPT